MTDTSLVGRVLVIFGRGFGIQHIKTTKARSKATISVPGLTLRNRKLSSGKLSADGVRVDQGVQRSK